jgi:hypothetical protein
MVMAMCMTLGLLGSQPAEGLPAANRFSTVGLYVWKGSPDQHAFWKACGINTLQYCDTHWYYRPDLLDDYYRKLASSIEEARADGFHVNVLLLSNIAQWKGPAEHEPTGMDVLFDPRDSQALTERLAAIRRGVRELRRAHSFTFFAGDPGGSIGAAFGPLPMEEWLRMARLVREIVREEAPEAEFNVNPWAIAYWQYPGVSCEQSEWWIREAELIRRTLNAPDLLGPDTGVELPGHGYYRAMALRVCARDGVSPDLVPTEEEVRELKRRGVRRIIGWPYFLLDEADDGDVGPEGQLVPGVQIETRYIHRLVARMRALGMTGIIGNWTHEGHRYKALNTYAFGRFCRDPRATPERVIEEYARCIADDSTWRDLAQVLRFIEGHSNWDRKLPEMHRLPPLACTLKSVEEAREALERVKPRARPRFALPEPPQDYLRRLAARLDNLAARAASPKGEAR